MSSAYKLQQLLFEYIKQRYPNAELLAKQLAELLNKTESSIYKRLRGEVTLSLEEFLALIRHFNIPINSLLEAETNSVLFQFPTYNITNAEAYLNELHRQMLTVYQCKERKIWYASKDLTVFHLCQKPNLYMFKMFIWQKYRQNGHQKFDIHQIDTKLSSTVFDMYKLFCQIDSVEVLSLSACESIKQQIMYCYDAGLLIDYEQLELLLSDLSCVIDTMEKQASVGKKIHPSITTEGNFELYYNEILLLNNTILAQLNGHFVGYTAYLISDYLTTVNQKFCWQIRDWFEQISSLSTFISKTSAKERARFFNHLRKTVSS